MDIVMNVTIVTTMDVSSKKGILYRHDNLISHLDYISKKDIGKKYFFTYEEAQTKLKELQNAHLI